MAEKPRRRPRSETKGRLRPLLVRMLAVWHDVTWKQLSAAVSIAQSKLSQHLKRGEVKDDLFEKLLRGMKSRPVVVLIVKGCIETLEDLVRVADLSEDQLLTIERAAQGSARRTREGLTEIARLSRRIVPAGYPAALDLKPLRRRADELWARLKDRAVAFWSAAVEAGEEYQSWSFCEKVCELSIREASRDLRRATALARLAVKIAERVTGPDWWRNRVRGYALAHRANILRVAGHLKAAEALLAEAKRLWAAGADPDGVLDPGRLPILEGPLLRDQRRFAEALACHDEAYAISRTKEFALIQKGFTLEVMGDYGRAVEVLWAAEPLVERQPEQHLKYMVPFNLAVNLTHLGRFHEAMALVQQARELVIELGDDINLYRVIWMDGRIAAGLGHSWKARKLLTEAREKFAAEKMSFDVVLALLEEAVLLLEEGRTAEVRVLTLELAEVFESKGVHREALAALRLFKDSVECERATAELARRVLNYFFRARYDQSLQFTSS